MADEHQIKQRGYVFDVLEFEHDRRLTTITLTTNTPGKWRLVDLETGQVWTWRDDALREASGHG